MRSGFILGRSPFSRYEVLEEAGGVDPLPNSSPQPTQQDSLLERPSFLSFLGTNCLKLLNGYSFCLCDGIDYLENIGQFFDLGAHVFASQILIPLFAELLFQLG